MLDKLTIKYINQRNNKLFFIHSFEDTFSYIFIDNTLTIIRTDTGWIQDLIAYISYQTLI